MDMTESANCNLTSSMPAHLSQNTPVSNNLANINFTHNNNNNFLSANNNNNNVTEVTSSPNGQTILANQPPSNWIDELILSAQRKPLNGTSLRGRDLPQSFWTPPKPSSNPHSASHSRESSLDQTSPLHQTPASSPSPASCITGNLHSASLLLFVDREPLLHLKKLAQV